MDLFFLCKRVVGMVVQPLPVFFLLVIAGALSLHLAKGKKGKRIAWLLLGAAPILLFLAAFPPLARWTARTMESAYPPHIPANADDLRPFVIAVLGNGVSHPGDPAMPALSRLNDTSRARLAEGVRLARVYPEARLVTSGYGMGLENCGDAMAAAAAELGIDPDRIHRLSESVDTDDEARLVGLLAEGRKVLVVTSAVHMPRAMESFRRRGVDAVPAPCDFIAPVSDRMLATVNRHRWRPQGTTVAENEKIWHEFMGLAYQRWFQGKAPEAAAGRSGSEP